MARNKKHITIKHGKLGRERAWGFVKDGSNVIHIDERLCGYRYLLYIIHESMHVIEPEWSESRVRKEANKDHAIVALNKFSNQNFYGKKFVTEVKAMAVETRRVKEAQRLAELLKLNKELMTAVLAGDLVKFQDLIKKGANPAYSDETGLTPLMIATQKEQKAVITVPQNTVMASVLRILAVMVIFLLVQARSSMAPNPVKNLLVIYGGVTAMR
jgi:hypothetical protein